MDHPTTRPRSDRRALEQVIAGLTDGVILVDPDQTIVWANAAALAMHGAAALGDLGADVDGYRKRFRLRFRNNHMLGEGQYPIERVIAGETFADVTVEVVPASAPEQRWVHSIRSLVIVAEDGAPDLLVLIVKDETERYEAEERFESAFNANPAPALICRLEDRVYVRANLGFLEMTGYAREQVVGRTVTELDVFAKSDRRELAHERIGEGRTIPQMEAELPLPDGAERRVIVAGEPIEIGDASCLLFTFADLEPRRKAETALRQSEERFAKSFRLSPAPAAIARLKGHVFVEVNEAFARLSGYADAEIVGRSAADLHLWDDPSLRRAMESAVVESGGVRDEAIRMRGKDGATIDCLASAETVAIGGEPCVLWAVQDITDRKRTEDELIVAIESVMADTSWFSRSIVEKLAALRQTSRKPCSGADLDDLTDRERAVLGLICEGEDDRAMSDRLKLSQNTIRNHVSALFRKIGVNRRAAAVIWARERGVTGALLRQPRGPRGRR